MRRQDGRKLDHKTLEAIRIRAVRQVQAGESPEVVVKALGLSRACIYNWLATYRAGGWAALGAKPLAGRPRRLTGPQIRWIYATVTQKNPLQLKFPFALWTRAIIRTLIHRRLGVTLSLASVGRLLAQLGLSCQKPLRRAFQQNSSLVRQWLEREYPAIRALAKAQGAAIFFADEAGVRSDFHCGTTWAPIGRTPVVRSTGARFGMNMISAISPRGELRFMVIEGKVSGVQFCEFLKRLMHRASRSIFLILDGHSAHRAKRVKELVASFGGKLRLFFLPSYSPELNPDELVWNDLKTHGLGRMTITDKMDMKAKVISHLRSLQRRPGKVRSFFCAPTTRYAA